MDQQKNKNSFLKWFLLISLLLLLFSFLLFFLVRDSSKEEIKEEKLTSEQAEEKIEFDEVAKSASQRKEAEKQEEQRSIAQEKEKSKEVRISEALQGVWQSCHQFTRYRFEFSSLSLESTKTYFENYDCTGEELFQENSRYAYEFLLPSKKSNNLIPIDYTLEEAHFILLSAKVKEREEFAEKMGMSFNDLQVTPLGKRLDYPLDIFPHLKVGTRLYDLIATGNLYLQLGDKCHDDASGQRVCVLPDSPEKRPTQVRLRLFRLD